MSKKIFLLGSFALISFIPGIVFENAANNFYQEGFEGSTFPPAGWRAVDVSGPEFIWERVTDIVHSGIASAHIGYNCDNFNEDWLITPRWTISSGDSLVFWLACEDVGFPPDSLCIRISTTDSNLTSFTTRILYLAEGNGYPLNEKEYQRYAVSLNQYAGQNIFIAFKHNDDCGDGLYIDDVRVGDPAVGIEPVSNEIHAVYSLGQNFPNPFNPTTKIKFDVPASNLTLSVNVKLIIYDILGREAAALVNEYLEPGSYEVEWDGRNFPSGVYFYKLAVSDPESSSGQSFTDTKKMLLVK